MIRIMYARSVAFLDEIAYIYFCIVPKLAIYGTKLFSCGNSTLFCLDLSLAFLKIGSTVMFLLGKLRSGGLRYTSYFGSFGIFVIW